MENIKAKVIVTGSDLTQDKVLEHLKALVTMYEAKLLKPDFNNSVICELTYELKDIPKSIADVQFISQYQEDLYTYLCAEASMTTEIVDMADTVQEIYNTVILMSDAVILMSDADCVTQLEKELS